MRKTNDIEFGDRVMETGGKWGFAAEYETGVPNVSFGVESFFVKVNGTFTTPTFIQIMQNHEQIAEQKLISNVKK